MSRIILILVTVLAIQSCNLIQFSPRHRYYPVPLSFDDSISIITKRLQNCESCNYFIYEEKLGNCFGSSLYASARIIWMTANGSYCRSIDAKGKRVTDKKIEKNFSELFEYFSNNRIDTIATLPKYGWSMDPVSYCNIIVRKGKLNYQKTFEMTPFFSTKDTLHPIYVFVKMGTH